MQSEIVSSTSGCSCMVGLVSDARDVDISEFGTAVAMILDSFSPLTFRKL